MRNCVFVCLVALAGCGGSTDRTGAPGAGEAGGPAPGGGAGRDGSGGAGMPAAGGSPGTAGSGGSAGVAGTGAAGTAGSAGGAGGGAGMAGAGGPGGMTGSPLDDADRMALVGHYGLRARSAMLQDVPLLGTQASTTEALGLVEIRAEGADLVFEERGCHVIVTGSGSVMTVIADAVPRSVPPQAIALEAWRDGDAVRFRRPAVANPVGVRLTDPENEALPTTASDARVFDQDGDGQPGVTVRVSGLASGDLFVVQRQRAAYEGRRQPDGRLAGSNSDRSEQSVIGATNPILGQNIPTRPDPDASRSTVELAPIEAGWDCDRLVAEAGRLFP